MEAVTEWRIEKRTQKWQRRISNERMKKFVIVFIFCFNTKLFAQAPSQLELLQGIWNYTMSPDTAGAFKLVSKKRCLDFTYSSNKNSDSEVTLIEMIVGFQSVVNWSDKTGVIYVDSLKENGLFFTEIVDMEQIEQGGLIDKAFCMIASYYECDGNILSINGGKLFEYEKILTLPFDAIQNLHRCGKIDKRNYIKDYLNLKVLTIGNTKCKVHSTPNGQTKLQLNKDDMIIVIEDRGNWLNVRYNDSGTGWIKKTDAR
jgi:hypothetical protein